MGGSAVDQEKEFQHESIEDTESIIRYLDTLADGFRRQRLEFRAEREQIILKPHGLIQLEIKAKNRNKKSKLSLKFTWKDPSGEKSYSGSIPGK